MCMFDTEDFWLGLRKIHSLAQQGAYILRIDLEDWKEEKHWAEYRFSLDGPSKDYTLHVSHFSGDLPNAIANITGTRFSTKDRNNMSQRNNFCTRNYSGKEILKLILLSLRLNPQHSNNRNHIMNCRHNEFVNTTLCLTCASCLDPLAGGWWFNGCGETNLNGRYLWLRAKGRSVRRKGIHWKPGTGPSYSLRMTKITVRPAQTPNPYNWSPQLTPSALYQHFWHLSQTLVICNAQSISFIERESKVNQASYKNLDLYATLSRLPPDTTLTQTGAESDWTGPEVGRKCWTVELLQQMPHRSLTYWVWSSKDSRIVIMQHLQSLAKWTYWPIISSTI